MVRNRLRSAATSTGGLNLGSGTINGDLGANSNGGAITQLGALIISHVTWDVWIFLLQPTGEVEAGS